MFTKFIYRCKKRGSLTDFYVTDLDLVRELYEDGFIISCRRFKGWYEKWLIKMRKL